MTATLVIAAADLSLSGGPAVSFALSPGETAVILTAQEEASLHLSRLLLGLGRPRQGRVVLFGTELALAGAGQLLSLRQRVGLAQGHGGLISNLKVWENLTLPVYYHGKPDREEVEETGLALLKRVGYAGRHMELPGHLSLLQKKQVGLARALIMDPELVVYESPEQGLDHNEKERYFRLIREFHLERPGRVSVILSCQPESAADFPGALTLEMKGQHA